MPSWFNGDATEFRSFLADLIDVGQIETINEVKSFCDNPRQYNNIYNQWLANGREFTNDDNDESDDDADDDDDDADDDDDQE